jgi:hypothetical protein
VESESRQEDTSSKGDATTDVNEQMEALKGQVTLLREQDAMKARALHWLLNGEVGQSSRAILRHMLGVPSENGDPFGSSSAHPLDPGDLRRCLLLLSLFPEWKERLGEMATVSQKWAALVTRWGELEAAFTEEMKKGNRSPTTYEMMKEILNNPKS